MSSVARTSRSASSTRQLESRACTSGPTRSEDVCSAPGKGVDRGEGLHQTVRLRAKGGYSFDILMSHRFALEVAESPDAFLGLSQRGL